MFQVAAALIGGAALLAALIRVWPPLQLTVPVKVDRSPVMLVLPEAVLTVITLVAPPVIVFAKTTAALSFKMPLPLMVTVPVPAPAAALSNTVLPALIVSPRVKVLAELSVRMPDRKS